MHPYEQLIFDRIASAIHNINSAERPEVYVIWLEYGTQSCSDVSGLEIAFHYNTDSYRREQEAEEGQTPEVAWSSAYWKHVDAFDISDLAQDAHLSEKQRIDLKQDWLSLTPLPTELIDSEGNREEIDEDLREGVREEQATKSALVTVVSALHASGMITEAFYRPIPIKIGYHEDDPDDANLTRAANPPGLAREAEEWILGRTYEQLDAITMLNSQIEALSPVEQSAYWIGVLKDIELDRESPGRRIAEDLKMSQFDVAERLGKVGRDAVLSCIELIEEFAPQEQTVPVQGKLNGAYASILTQEGRERLEKRMTRRPTPAQNLTGHALRAIRAIGTANDAEVKRLIAVMEHLFEESIDAEWIGANLFGVAGILHVLRPARFPNTKTGPRDNKLLNFEAYGLGENKK